MVNGAGEGKKDISIKTLKNYYFCILEKMKGGVYEKKR